MKKIISTLFLVILILVGCQTDNSLGITPLDRVNLEVEEMISVEDNLQFIHYEDQSYIVIQSTGDVSAELEEEDETIILHFDVENEEGNEIRQHIFELTAAVDYEMIVAYLNGEMTPFDTISI